MFTSTMNYIWYLLCVYLLEPVYNLFLSRVLFCLRAYNECKFRLYVLCRSGTIRLGRRRTEILDNYVYWLGLFAGIKLYAFIACEIERFSMDDPRSDMVAQDFNHALKCYELVPCITPAEVREVFRASKKLKHAREELIARALLRNKIIEEIN